MQLNHLSIQKFLFQSLAIILNSKMLLFALFLQISHPNAGQLWKWTNPYIQNVELMLILEVELTST